MPRPLLKTSPPIHYLHRISVCVALVTLLALFVFPHMLILYFATLSSVFCFHNKAAKAQSVCVIPALPPSFHPSLLPSLCPLNQTMQELKDNGELLEVLSVTKAA